MPPDHSSSPTSPASRSARFVWLGLFVAVLLVRFVLWPGLERWLGQAGDDAAPVAPAAGPNAEVASAGRDAAKTAVDEKTTVDEKTAEKKKKPQFAGLKDVGGNVKVSPAGLRYVPGSEEGHRLKHVRRHAQDDPDRPGKHGVFDGGDETALAAIDEAYELAKAGGPRVRKRQEGDRTVYEVNLGRRIGYLGGKEGQRLGHPATRQVRLVLEGNKVITAFPF